MPEEIQPTRPGWYIRYMKDTNEWQWNEWHDGYWVATGIFPHEVQEAPWRGAVLIAHVELDNQLEQYTNWNKLP